jgi:hypothetical protein
MLSPLLVLLGFFAGLLGAMTGIGGGILLTPILALHFGIPIRQAIGTSLVAVITTSAASSSVHLQRHTTDIRLGMTLELATSLARPSPPIWSATSTAMRLRDCSPASCCTAPSPFCCVEAKSEIRKNFPPRITVKL